MKKVIFLIILSQFLFQSNLSALAPITNNYQDDKIKSFLLWAEKTRDKWLQFQAKWEQLLQSNIDERSKIYDDLIDLFDELLTQHDKLFELNLTGDERFAVVHCFKESNAGIVMLGQLKSDDDIKELLLKIEDLNSVYITLVNYTSEINIIIRYLEKFLLFKRIVFEFRNNKYFLDFEASC